MSESSGGQRGPSICLVSPVLPSMNPRLVKEAGALAGAGYRVRCVTGQFSAALDKFADASLAGTGASAVSVPPGPRGPYLARRLVQEAVRRAGRLAERSDAAASWAASPVVGQLVRAAAAEPADLFIGHQLPGLVAAVLAAERRGALAGFDAEDWHPGETGDRRIDRIAGSVEQRFLPRCAHLTAASPLIAERYAGRSPAAVTTVLNTFPRAEAPPPDPPDRGPGDPLRLYWFSQTIGAGRGLEAALAGAGRAETRCELAVRGTPRPGYADELEAVGRAAGVPVAILPPDRPDRMPALAARHDVGLSLELAEPPNRNLCLTNKVFTYLTAGRPQLLSETRAQAGLAPELGAAARLIDLSDAGSVAAGIDAFADSERWRTGAAEARELGAARFSWDMEAERLVAAVDGLLRPEAVIPRADGRCVPAGNL